MAAYNAKPKILDGLIVLGSVCPMGAPGGLGEHINHILSEVLFWGGAVAMVLFLCIRWGRWFLGFAKSEGRAEGIIDNRRGNYVGGDNSAPQTVIHGPVTVHHAPREHSSLYEAQLQE